LIAADRLPARKDARMEIPPREELMGQVAALPGAAALLKRLDPHAPPVHLVGGAVRDLLLGRTPPELDLVVEGDVAPVAARLGGEIRAHDRFGTATVTVDGWTCDLARARRESYGRPGALPDVEPAELREDLGRRDFTVNTGAIALTGPQPGTVVSDPHLPADLKAGVLRVLHDASFIDDPTRLLRLARYAGRLGFTVEPHTRTLVDEAVRSGALSTVTGARIGTELRLLAGEPDPLAALAALHELGLDTPLGLDGDAPSVERARRALALLPAGERPDRLVLAAALDRRARTDAPGALRSRLELWAFEAADREAILAAASRSQELAGALDAAATPSEIAAAARHAPPELVALAGALGPAAVARQWLERLRHVRLEITGDDLLAAGIPRGEAIGRGLRAALREKLDARVAGRDEELRAAVRAAGLSQ
jgi:tRNA nucleotidyltransferase (CCA-adding enzyme)